MPRYFRVRHPSVLPYPTASNCRDSVWFVFARSLAHRRHLRCPQLGISTGGRKTQLKARIRQKLSVSPRSSGTIDDRAAVGASDGEAGNGGVVEDLAAYSGPGSMGDTSAAAVTFDPNSSAASGRPDLGDSCDGESAREQESAKSRRGTMPEEPQSHDLSPPECDSMPTVEKYPAERAATAEASSVSPLSEREGELLAVAAATATPVDVVEVTALPLSPGELDALGDPVDKKKWKEEEDVLHGPAAEHAEPELFQGEDDDDEEEGGGVEADEVGVVLLEKIPAEEGIGADAENDRQRVQSTPGQNAEPGNSVQQPAEVEEEYIQELELAEGDQYRQGRQQLNGKAEQERDGQSPDQDVESPAVLAAAADVHAFARGEVLPSLLLSPGSGVARVATSTSTAPEQSVEEEGAMGAEEGEDEEEGAEGNFAVPSAEYLVDKYIQVEVRAGGGCGDSSPGSVDRSVHRLIVLD